MVMDSRRTDGQLAVETMTDSWGKTREGRQTDCRGIDGQPVRVSLEMGGFKQLLSTLTFNQGLSTASTVKHGLNTWIVQSYSPGGYL